MRYLRIVLPALALVATGSWVAQATACDKDKATAAAASHGSCAADAKSAAKTASMDCCASKSAATTAAHRRSGTRGMVVATTADMSEHCAGMMGATFAVAGAGGSCAAKGKTTAVAAGSGGQCSGHSSTTSARMAHGDCDACEDMILCSGELETAGTRTQIVPLKNGVMFVYTAEEPGKVNAVQSAMARRSERLNQIVTAGDRARLCPECKSLRGAIASGKMTREVINIEGGALTLMTSNDPLMVKKIRAIAEANKVTRSKS